ncbi:Crp/Fnr family transcriptional regulator [Poseidonibacter lekithochrous]|uniref:Crp/Fnr family transcriptional regulator n=1 Tax=Poseidonibacter lekithochrous TaxID=1904463 RepID=UPI001D177BB3|nr:Crp/Fnr family transcriptional regulator [Poseidonibacter lekithochrous]
MPKNTQLFHQGDRCQDILFLTKGTVRVYRQHESGKEITLYYLQPFEQCNVNLSGGLSNILAIGSAITEDEVEGYYIDSNIIKEIFFKEESFRYYVLELFASRLDSMANLIEDLRFKNIDERLLEWLELQNQKVITTTHDIIASHLGTSREIISRILKNLEEKGILKLSRGKIELL